MRKVQGFARDFRVNTTAESYPGISIWPLEPHSTFLPSLPHFDSTYLNRHFRFLISHLVYLFILKVASARAFNLYVCVYSLYQGYRVHF